MRTSKISKNRISYYVLEEYRNHTTLFKRRYCGSHMCKYRLVKLVRAVMWKLVGKVI
jgi:hypothetical protein